MHFNDAHIICYGNMVSISPRPQLFRAITWESAQRFSIIDTAHPTPGMAIDHPQIFMKGLMILCQHEKHVS